ncbi:DUF2513 domain-containing protein [Lactobacillus gasseri]|uniref:DUF2513 domain-containing protein n=1 Tax=Lactobacillus gasseri TaxID=1596 RepID=UPI000DE969FD|nr:DUF2513 domain-containing protein [Lactobacillus gasseri]RBQ00698.1 hypothetical protein C3745_07195 [Lactobacillus gasseri]
MELNNDCIRDVLLFIEDSNYPPNFLVLSDFFGADNLRQYYPDVIRYTILKLYEAKYINLDSVQIKNGYLLDFRCVGISWIGHQFLENIREHTTWNIVKQKAKIVGSASIAILSKIAEDYIEQKLNLK